MCRLWTSDQTIPLVSPSERRETGKRGQRILVPADPLSSLPAIVSLKRRRLIASNYKCDRVSHQKLKRSTEMPIRIKVKDYDDNEGCGDEWDRSLEGVIGGGKPSAGGRVGLTGPRSAPCKAQGKALLQKSTRGDVVPTRLCTADKKFGKTSTVVSIRMYKRSTFNTLPVEIWLQ